MKHAKCSPVSGEKCEYVAKGDTEEQVADTLLKHMQHHHPNLMENMSDRQMEILRQKIIENAADTGAIR